MYCRRLGNFVKLVDQMIVEHMFHLTKTQVTMFVSTVLKTGQSPLRDGFFKANLVFTKHGMLFVDKFNMLIVQESFLWLGTKTVMIQLHVGGCWLW